jgi:hypothetical protein
VLGGTNSRVVWGREGEVFLAFLAFFFFSGGEEAVGAASTGEVLAGFEVGVAL